MLARGGGSRNRSAQDTWNPSLITLATSTKRPTAAQALALPTAKILAGARATALAHYSPIENYDLFASVGYQRAAFTQELRTLPGVPLAPGLSRKVPGKQLPDAPYWLSTIGESWRLYGLTFTPLVRVVNSRSGDTSKFQPIARYAPIDPISRRRGRRQHRVENDDLSSRQYNCNRDKRSNDSRRV